MTRKINPLYLCLLFWLLSSPAWAQQTAYVGLFQENWVLLNPAFVDHAHLEDRYNTIMVNSSYRQQWLGFAEAPRQMNVRFEQIVTTDVLGKWDEPQFKWGLGFTREQVASFTGTGLQGNFAYYIEPAPDLRVGGGFNVGVVGQGLKLNAAQFEDWGADQYAQDLNTLGQNWWLNSDLGISVMKTQQLDSYNANVYYAGFSIPQIISANIKRDSAGVLSKDRPPHLNFLLGAFFESRYLNIEPSMWVRSLPGATFYPLLFKQSPVSVDLSVKFSIKNDFNKNYFWGAGGYSTSGYVNAAFGYQHSPNSTRLKGGLMMNVPVSQRTLGYSVEAFLGIAIAQ